MPAGITIKEFATDPSIGMPQPLREQHVACGPAPSVSEPFSPQTRFVVMKVGLGEPHNEDRSVHAEIGLDPLPSLIARWKNGDLDRSAMSDIGFEHGKPIVRAVGPGGRIAVIGLNTGGHGHPASPDMSAGG
jgi:hypothetical protein